MNIPGYELLEKVGEGSMAVVWKAHQKSLDRNVAIKILKPEFSKDLDEVRDFVREARSAAAIKHGNVIQVIDIAQHESTFYIVMEMIHGPSVGELLKQKGRLPQKRALQVALPVARALEHAWNTRKIIHRDVKPHNILIDDDGTVKLSDLGLARMVDANMSTQLQTGVLVGTPNYVSPEQVRCDPEIDCRTDMYSLGASIYHMVTGRLPFADMDTREALEAQVKGHLPNPRDITPDVSPGVAQLIARLMMKNSSDRYKDWAHAVKSIKRVAAGSLLINKDPQQGDSTISPSAAATRPPPSPGGRKTERRKGLPVGVHAALWGTVVLIWVVIAYHRMKLPPLRLLTEKMLNAPRRVETQSSNSKSTTPKASTTSPRVTPRKRPPPPPRVVVDGNPGTQEQNNTEVTYALYDAARGAVRELYNENFTAAASAIDTELGKPHPKPVMDALLEISGLIPEIVKAPVCIEAEFMRLTGTDVSIRHNGQNRTVLVRSVAADKIRGMVRTSSGERAPVTFTISQLNAGERARWMGKADTEAKAALKFILFMKDKDYSAAGSLVPLCGPLAKIFRIEVNAKTGQAQ